VAAVRLTDTGSMSVDIEGKDKFYLSSSHNEQTQAYELVNAN